MDVKMDMLGLLIKATLGLHIVNNYTHRDKNTFPRLSVSHAVYKK